MLDKLTVTNWRGIRSGEVGGLTRLSVLLGPNGCGKTAVLEAIGFAMAESPGRALEDLVARRGIRWNAGNWIIHAREKSASVRVSAPGMDYSLRLDRVASIPEDVRALAETNAAGPYETLTWLGRDGSGFGGDLGFSRDNRFVSRSKSYRDADRPAARAEWGGSNAGTLLEDAFSTAVKAGGLESLASLIREAQPVAGADRPMILTDEGRPVLSIVARGRGGAVPVDVLGEGSRELVRLAIDLAGTGVETVLVDEPGRGLHPRGIVLTAGVLAAAAVQGKQLILATHSLDLLDALIAKLPPEHLALLSVHRLLLEDGVLSARAIAGDSVARLRTQLDEDLR